jgi:hypothetical protein
MQETITRVLKASKAAGMPVRIEIEQSKIVVLPAGITSVEPEIPHHSGAEIVL